MTQHVDQDPVSLPQDYNEASKHSFCVLPWLHRFVNLGGEVQLCCTAEEYDHSYIRQDNKRPINITDGFSDEQIGDSNHMRDIRLAMLSAEWPAACERCRLTEQGGGCSRRQSENQHFDKHIPWILENTDQQGFAPVRIRSRDYRLGNLCNLRCRMCHPRASKLLLDEWNEIARPRLRVSGEQAREYQNMSWFHNQQLWDDFSKHCRDLEHLHFAGGEPLIMPEVQKALEICVEQGVAEQIELTFNTNITKIPANHRELWPRFKSVNLICSIDAYGPLNDYIRYPAKWTRLERNLDIIEQQHETLNLGWVTLSATVQIYNIFHLHELIDYCHKRFSFIRRMPGLIHLAIPDYFNIQNLPDDLKQLAENRLRELRARLVNEGISDDLQQIDSILSYLVMGDFSPHLMNEFKRVTGIFDRLRNESITALVPELHQLMVEQGNSGRILGWFKLVTSRGKWLMGRVKSHFFSYWK
jgi:sulfatase maturation enzyme AslB (radical SAM superfamily)